MTFIPKPVISHPGLSRNARGLTVRDYEGALSTLCAGCGHDSITAAIVRAAYEVNLEPHRLAKMSGIGCSSKTPAYFVAGAHGFNSVHGRMPSVTTGANAANRELIYLGVSGDGDTASIGLGQFAHAIRRRLNMTYIVENNGCYGLTKGQFSATADIGSKSKSGIENQYPPIDPAVVAIQLGAGFVARSFSGDKEQLVPLIKAALSYRGFSLIDVVSPCVTFNNHEGSTKSYSYTRSHDEELTAADYIAPQEEIHVNYKDKTTVTLHDGSRICLRKLDKAYDPSSRINALSAIEAHTANGEIGTGVLFLDPVEKEMHDYLGTIDSALRDIPLADLVPGAAALERIMQRLR